MTSTARQKKKLESSEHLAMLIEQIILLSDNAKIQKSPVEIITEKAKSSNAKETTLEPESNNQREFFLAQQSYLMQSRNYQLFLKSLDEAYTTNVTQKFAFENYDGKKEAGGFEVISFKERVEVARKIHMNALLGAGHNHVQPKDMDAYRYWTMASKFNQMLSFIMYDRAISGG